MFDGAGSCLREAGSCLREAGSRLSGEGGADFPLLNVGMC